MKLLPWGLKGQKEMGGDNNRLTIGTPPGRSGSAASVGCIGPKAVMHRLRSFSAPGNPRQRAPAFRCAGACVLPARAGASVRPVAAGAALVPGPAIAPSAMRAAASSEAKQKGVIRRWAIVVSVRGGRVVPACCLYPPAGNHSWHCEQTLTHIQMRRKCGIASKRSQKVRRAPVNR